MAIGGVDDRHDVPARRGSGRRHVLRRVTTNDEREISPARRRALPPRRLAVGAERRSDGCPRHGSPRAAFSSTRWEGYSEALLLYVLGLGSPTHPLPATSYTAWTRTYHWKKLYGHEFLYAGPLFIHQLSHMWIDFRGIQDDYMRERGIDYFENSRRATLAQQQYAIRNPKAVQGLRRDTAGGSPRAMAPARRNVGSMVSSAASTTTRRAEHPVRSGRRHHRAVGGGRFAAVRARDRPAGDRNISTRPTRRCEDEYGFKCSFNPTFVGSVTIEARVGSRRATTDSIRGRSS